MNGCCPPVPPQCQPFDIPGSPGQNAFSTITAPFAIPPDTATPIIITMASTAWLVPGQFIIVGDQVDGRATFVVQGIIGPTMVSALWTNAAGDSISGTIFNPSNNPTVSGTGAPGMSGTNGFNAYTILTSNAAIPIDTNTTVTFAVANSQWAVVGQTIVVGDLVDGVGTFRIVAITDATHITAVWLNAVGDAPALTPLLTSNLAQVSPAGIPASSKFRFITVPASPPNNGTVTTETTLISANIPANTLVNTGDSLEFEAVFLLSGSANNTVRVYFGATVMLTYGPLGVTAQNLIVRGRIVRTGVATEYSYVSAVITNSTAANNVDTQVATPAETLSGAVLLKCTGQNSSGASVGVTQTSLYIRLNPA